MVVAVAGLGNSHAYSRQVFPLSAIRFCYASWNIEKVTGRNISQVILPARLVQTGISTPYFKSKYLPT